MFHFQFFIVSKSGFVERIAWSSENGKNLDISSGGVFAWERSNEMMREDPIGMKLIIEKIYEFATKALCICEILLHFHEISYNSSIRCICLNISCFCHSGFMPESSPGTLDPGIHRDDGNTLTLVNVP